VTSSAHLALADRPVLRGRLHVAAFWLAAIFGLVVVLAADGLTAQVTAMVYVATLLVGFGVSAVYHRVDWSPVWRDRMQRLDHAAIYVWISGTYVPLCVLVLPSAWGVPLLAVVGVGALVGITLQLLRRGRRTGYVLYPVLGWAAVAVAPALWWYLDPLEFWLVVSGGIAYTLGFPVLLVKRPDPVPHVFGYHEVWHSFTVVAAALHFAAVGLMTAA
jgi:hemolysin III